MFGFLRSLCSASTSVRQPRRSFRPALEHLEDRAVPTAVPNPVNGVLTLQGDQHLTAFGDATDTIELGKVGNFLSVIWVGPDGPTDTRSNIPLSSITQININPGLGWNTVTIDSDLQFSGKIVVTSETSPTSHVDILTIKEKGPTAPFTISSTRVEHMGMSPVEYNLGGDAEYSNYAGLTISGTGNAATVYNIESVPVGTVLTIDAAGGDDTFNISPQARFLDNAIEGSLVLNGGTGFNRLNIYDQNNSFNDHYTLTTEHTDPYWPGKSYGSLQRELVSGIQFIDMGRVSLYAGSGNQTFNLTTYTSGPTVLIDAGAGNDTINGGAGNEILIGGSDVDTIYGNGGRDIIIGGPGSDTLSGGAGEDILIGGSVTLSYDSLFAVMQEWSRTDLSYLERLNHLRNGGYYSGGYNWTAVLVRGSTVIDDRAEDRMTGNGDLDAFWQDPWSFTSVNGRWIPVGGDTVSDLTTGEMRF